MDLVMRHAYDQDSNVLKSKGLIKKGTVFKKLQEEDNYNRFKSLTDINEKTPL